MLLKPAVCTAGTPYTKGTGLMLPSSLNRFALFVLACSARGTILGSWYGHLESFPIPFSRAPGLRFRLLLFPALLPFSPLWLSRDLYRLNTATAVQTLAQSVRNETIVAENVSRWYANMNAFPFWLRRITCSLRTD